MFLGSIIPLDTLHADEICRDIEKQYEQGSLSCALFMMTPVPEGDPVIDKAKIFAEKFDIFKEKLKNCGVQVGALVQCSIGHGYQLNNPNAFTRYTNLRDGEETYTVCPYDKDFQNYIRDALKTIAAHKPDVIMVDDDFRLMARAGRGCACKLHLDAVSKLAGRTVTREEILKAVDGVSDEDKKLTQIFIETQGESLLQSAKAMREGIDAVDKSIPGMFCCCGNGAEYSADIAKILAGEGNPVVVRVNNGRYTAPGARGLSGSMLRAAVQMAVMRGKVDMFLAETDTCPQNRYSTAASALHSHFTGSILEGVSGAKHWITRLSSYEPDSGKAYRRLLAKNRGFYEELSKAAPTLSWLGCRIPVSSRPSYGFASAHGTSEGWSNCVLERLGLPMYFSERITGAAFLCGYDDEQFTDEEILEFFKKPLFLASDTAKRLNDRGFLKYTGVDVRPWNGKTISGETLFVNGNNSGRQKNAMELIPVSAETKALSDCYNIPDGKTHVSLFPGVTSYKNPLGGTTVVFCGTPLTVFSYTEAFSFLNESRKKQLISLLDLPVYYPEDAEVYLRAADMPDGKLFVSFFNIGLDILEDITLYIKRDVRDIKYLTCDGRWESVRYAKRGEYYHLEKPAYTLEPVILTVE